MESLATPNLIFEIALAESSAIAEATVKLPADFDLQTARQKIQAAIDSSYPAIQSNEGYSGWNDIIQLTLTAVTWNNNGDIWQCTWELTDADAILLGGREKVKVTYVTAESAAGLHIRDQFVGTLTEASTTDGGWNWKIQIMQSGKTLTPNMNLAPYGLPGKMGYKDYLAEAVRDAAPFFENVPFQVRPVKAHLSVANGGGEKMNPNEELRRIGGNVHNVTIAESADRVALLADLTLRDNPPGRATRLGLLAEAAKPGGLQYGVSYTGFGECFVRDPESPEPTLAVQKITQVDSVDPCPLGNAGGMIIAAAEAALSESASHTTQNTTMTPAQKAKLAMKLGALAAKFPKLISLAEATDGDGGGETQDVETVVATAYLKDTPAVAGILKDAAAVLANPDAVKAMMAWLDTKLASPAEPDADDATDDTTTAEVPVAEAAKLTSVLQSRIQALELSNMRNLVDARLATIGGTLGDDAKEDIRERFKGRLAEAAEIDTSIRRMKKLTGGVSTSLAFAESVDVQQGDTEYDKKRKGVIAFIYQNADAKVLAEAAKDYGFNPTAKENRMWTSFKDMYLSCIGGTGLGNGAGFGTGARGIHGGAMAEAASTGILSQLIQDAMHHRMVNEYVNEGEWDFYKLVSTPVPVTDFRAYHDQHFGYSSNPMAVIAEDTDYPEIPLTGNEDVQTTLVERGGIFGIGWRAVLNDDVNFVIKIAPRLAMGAKKQLAKGVGDIFVNSFTATYGPDGIAIIDDSGSATPGVATGGHKNYLGKAAINTAGQMALAERLFAEQTELGGGDAMGITPDYLLYSPYERQHAYPVLTPGQGQLTAGNAIGIQGVLVATQDQSVGLRGIKVPYWTKATNAYFVVPDPRKLEYIHVLYLNGQEEPQIYQEVLNSGLSFTRKRMQMRFEHHWQSNAIDFRGFAGGHVS